jgi:hypothetical protein
MTRKKPNTHRRCGEEVRKSTTLSVSNPRRRTVAAFASDTVETLPLFGLESGTGFISCRLNELGNRLKHAGRAFVPFSHPIQLEASCVR